MNRLNSQLFVALAIFCVGSLAETATVGADGEQNIQGLWLPRKFAGTITIEAFMVPEEQEYPPRWTEMEVLYDLDAKKARVDVKRGLEKDKLFLRRFDLKQEYEILQGDFVECRREHLLEKLEVLPFPSDLRVVPDKFETVEGRVCRIWYREDEWSSVSIFQDVETGMAIRITDRVHDGTELVPALSFTFTSNTKLNEEATPLLNDAAFSLPSPFTHKTCLRHVGGTPWIELFQHYLRV